MTSIGTGYDLSNSVFSPDGRVFQVEYASKAVENGSTSIGIRCKDGVVFAVEKITTSKLLKAGANRRVQSVDTHVGVVYSGMTPDGRHVVSRARDEARQWRDTFREQMPIPTLAANIASYVQLYTVYNSVRPFGVTTIVGGVDDDGSHLFMIDPSGQSWGYRGAAAGRGRQAVNSELEKLDFETLTVNDAVKEAARILYIAHEDNKDKDFELEISWVTKENGGRHELIPADLLTEVKVYAEEQLDADMES